MPSPNLIGIGLYTPAEAQRLTGIPAAKITRWLKGHTVRGRTYDPLWTSQVTLEDDRAYLGFRDLMEMRTANAFMQAGMSPQLIRRAIQEARHLIADQHPLSTSRFKTDGRSIFLEVILESGDQALIDVFRRQFAFKQIIEQSLRDVDYDGIAPGRWWPASRARGIVVDPKRSFGQPIDSATGVPTTVLANAYKAEGSYEDAARMWCVKPGAIRRAVEFETTLARAA